MRRSLTVLGLIIFSVCAYAVGVSAAVPVVNVGGCLKTWTFKSKDVVWVGRWDQKDAKIINDDLNLIVTDLADLKTSYTCVHDASLKAASSDVNQYKAIISDAAEINKYAAVFKTHLSDLTDNINNFLNTQGLTTVRAPLLVKSATATNTMLSKALASLAPVIKDVTIIVTNSAALAAGNFEKYKTERNAASMGPKTDEIKVEDITAPIIEKTKDDPLLKEKESLVAKVDGLTPDKTEEAFAGDYVTPDKLTEFTTNLQNKKYALTASVSPTVRTLNNSSSSPDTTTNGTANLTADELQKKIDDAATAKANQQVITDMQQKMHDIELKESIPPASSTSNTTANGGGAAGGGASGSVTAQAPQPPDFARDAERKKWLERARQMDADSMKRAMAQAMKGGKAAGKLTFVKERGSTFSLKDLFGKSDDTTTTTTDKKTKDKDLAFMDKDFMSGFAGTDSDKYKKYYGTGVGPNEGSSKNLNRSNFDNMYEQARIKALTEDATEELAGRYVDLFLLVHSIVDDYYRKGLLVDTSEVIEPVSLKGSPSI